MNQVLRILGLAISKGWRYVARAWKAGGAFLKTPAAKGVGKWFWRALDFAAVGSLFYELASDDADPESLSRTNDMIIDAILCPPVMAYIQDVPVDKEAIDGVFIRNGLLLQDNGGLLQIQGMSMVCAVAYTDKAGVNGVVYSFQEMKDIMDSISKQIKTLYASTLGADGETEFNNFSTMLKNLNEDEMDFTMRKNLDYLAFFFDGMAAEALAGGDSGLKASGLGTTDLGGNKLLLS